MVTHATNIYFIDVAVTNPESATAISQGSSEKALVAANIREKSKISSYKRYLNPDSFKLFIPFILENTGRLSITSIKFIDELCKLDKLDLELSDDVKYYRKKFIEDVNLVLARSNATVMSLYRAAGAVKGIY